MLQRERVALKAGTIPTLRNPSVISIQGEATHLSE
jgi:hypothetical protein